MHNTILYLNMKAHFPFSLSYARTANRRNKYTNIFHFFQMKVCMASSEKHKHYIPVTFIMYNSYSKPQVHLHGKYNLGTV